MPVWDLFGSLGAPWVSLDSGACRLPCLPGHCSGSPLWLDREPLEGRDWVLGSPEPSTSRCLVSIYGMDEKSSLKSEAHALCTRRVPGTVEKLTGNWRERKEVCL